MVEFLIKAIVEIAGSPKEFVEKTMTLLLEHMEKDEEFTLKDKHQEKTEEHEGVWSTFTELEAEFKNFTGLVHFCFKYMPSNIEIERPSRIELRREDAADMLNDLMMNLHKLDEIVKDVKARHKLVEGANKVLIKNVLFLALKEKPLNENELAKATGIGLKNLKPILDFYEDKALIKKKGKKYQLK